MYAYLPRDLVVALLKFLAPATTVDLRFYSILYPHHLTVIVVTPSRDRSRNPSRKILAYHLGSRSERLPSPRTHTQCPNPGPTLTLTLNPNANLVRGLVAFPASALTVTLNSYTMPVFNRSCFGRRFSVGEVWSLNPCSSPVEGWLTVRVKRGRGVVSQSLQ